MKYKKIFIISLLLIAILAIGAASASEDISDDPVAAIEPTDEVVTDSVEEEPVEVINQPVNEKIEESSDSSDELTDMEDDFYVGFYNSTESLDFDTVASIVTRESNKKNGTIKVYVGNEFRNEADMEYGCFDYANHVNFSPNDLGITEYGTYFINVTFTEKGTTTEIELGTSEITISEIDVRFADSISRLSDDLLMIYSGSNKNATINIYANDKKTSFTITNGIFESYDGREAYILVRDLGISEIGVYNIKVSIKDKGSNSEKIIEERKVPLVFFTFDDEYDYIGTNETLDFKVRFPGLNSGNVSLYEYESGVKGKKIGEANIVNGVATLEITGKSFTKNYNYLILEYTTPYEDGNRTFSIRAYENVGNVAVSLPSQINEGNYAAITFNSSSRGSLKIIVDGKTVRCEDISSLKYIVPDLTVGTHHIRIIYFGKYLGADEAYNSIYEAIYINNFKITVKKATPAPVKVATKIVASKKTFKVKTKTKKYTITLKAGKKLVKKVKVTLKVKGKTYKATTNSKGKATFKIKNLKKKGRYTATIKFAGNKNYKASSKKVKITVKK